MFEATARTVGMSVHKGIVYYSASGAWAPSSVSFLLLYYCYYYYYHQYTTATTSNLTTSLLLLYHNTYLPCYPQPVPTLHRQGALQRGGMVPGGGRLVPLGGRRGPGDVYEADPLPVQPGQALLRQVSAVCI